MIRNIVIFLLLLFNISFGLTNQEKEQILRVIQGAYKDKIYSVVITKSLEYLKKTNKKDKYRKDVIKALMYSLYYTKNKDLFWKEIKEISKENIPEEDKKTYYKLGLNLFKDQPEKLAYFYEKLQGDIPAYEKRKILKFLALEYMKKGKWEDVLSLPDNKEIVLYKVIALYKLKRYKDVIKKTDKLGIFPPDVKDTALYFRGLAFYKLGKEKNAVKTIEAITFKTPEMIQFLANYYLKKKNYLYAERYLKILTLEEGFKDYAYYYLAVIEDLAKNYKKAIEYYKKAAAYNTKYGKKAKERLKVLEKALPLYSVRLILLSSEDKAKSFIKKKKLKNCFVKKYKSLYGVYCGKFETLEDAKAFSKKLQEKGFDTYIQKL